MRDRGKCVKVHGIKGETQYNDIKGYNIERKELTKTNFILMETHSILVIKVHLRIVLKKIQMVFLFILITGKGLLLFLTILQNTIRNQ